MKNTHIYAAISMVALVAIFYTVARSSQTGAVPGATAAPGDAYGSQACGYPGCHSVTPITNSTELAISLIDPATGNAVTSYQAGVKYTVRVELTDSKMKVAGFESTVENPSHVHVGTLATKTKCQFSDFGHTYLTHTYPPSLTSTGYSKWEYYWTTPAGASQPSVTIYAAGNAGTGQDISTLDRIYTTNKTFTFNSSAGIDGHILSDKGMQVFPNPAVDRVLVSYSLVAEAQVSIDLYDLSGKLVRELQNERKPSGETTVSADISDLKKGIYLLKITAGGETSVQKVLVAR